MATKRGRPKKAKADVRKKPLRILLNEEERRLIDDKAAAATLDSSTWARTILVEAARPAVGRASGVGVRD